MAIKTKTSCHTFTLLNLPSEYKPSNAWVTPYGREIVNLRREFSDGGSVEAQAEYYWTDGEHIYVSHSNFQYVLEGKSWKEKVWNGYPDTLKAGWMWTDGTNVYTYLGQDSTGSTTGMRFFRLNKTTSTWEEVTFHSLPTHFYSNWLWTDGTNIYYSKGTDQLVLDKNTLTWYPKEWLGLTQFEGKYVWSDGTHIYYSEHSAKPGDVNGKQYILDEATSTWTTVTWVGVDYIWGDRLWTLDGEIYYGNQVLDKEARHWVAKSWSGASPSYYLLWTDGNNIFQQTGMDTSRKVWMLARANSSIYLSTGAAWQQIEGMRTSPLITFTITFNGNHSYAAEEGMTWETWINSQYNNGDVFVHTLSDGGKLICYNNDWLCQIHEYVRDAEIYPMVRLDDVIDPNKIYKVIVG